MNRPTWDRHHARDRRDPGTRTIEEVSRFLKVKPEDLIKTSILTTNQWPVAVLIRGDHELNEVKVKNFLKAAEMELADERTIEEVTGGPLGSSGPVGLEKVTILADHAIRGMSSAVVGANGKDAHLVDVNPLSDFRADHYGDFRAVPGVTPVRDATEVDPIQGHRGGSRIQTRDQVLGGNGRPIPRRGRSGKAHDYGLLRHRSEQDHCRGHRAESR